MRIMRLTSSVLRAALLVALPASAARAQVPLVPGALSIGAGVALPMSTGTDLVKPGINVEAGYRIGIPLTPFAVRAEGSYTRFSSNASPVSAGGFTVTNSGSLTVTNVGGAVEFTVLPLIVLRGYVVASAGYTMAKGDFSITAAPVASGSYNGFGYGAGAGIETHLPILPVAGIEARVKYVPNAIGGKAGLVMVPITARITF